MEKHTLEAWTVVVFDDFISARHDKFGGGRALFATRDEAERFLSAQPGMEQDQNGKVIPCTVTYEV